MTDIFTDVFTGDVGINIEYDGDQLMNFRNTLREKIEQKTGFKNSNHSLDNKNELIVSLAPNNHCPIWIKIEDKNYVRLDVNDLEQKISDDTFTCTFTALFCGGAITAKGQTVCFDEEWKLTNMT